MKKTIIFDFDGTLANSLEIMIGEYNKLAPRFNTKAIETPQALSYYQKIPPNQAFKELNISPWKLPLLMFYIKKNFKKHIDSIELYDEMHKIITQLKKEGFQLGILTNNSKKSVQKFLKNKQLLHSFDFIHNAKGFYGKADKLEKLIKKHHLNKQNIIYIGDEAKDIQACQKVNIPIISVCWGANSSELLKTYNPNYLIEKPIDILTIFAKK